MITPRMPLKKLYNTLLEALQGHESRCLDNRKEREAVARDLAIRIAREVATPGCPLCFLDTTEARLLERLVAAEHQSRKADGRQEGLKELHAAMCKQTADLLEKLGRAANIALPPLEARGI